MKELRKFFYGEEGMGTVEIILIIVVLVGLVVIFRKQLNDLVTRIFNQINADSNSILG
ncbi:MAG: Flp1 family type IVb pilin [bacterium]